MERKETVTLETIKRDDKSLRITNKVEREAD